MKVFINPGHAPNGNPDPGAVNAKTGLRESDVAAAVGSAAAQYLINAGVAAAVLQHDDLTTVCDTANASGADLFISIHCNAADSAAALGTETYCYPGSSAGQALANVVQRQIVDSLHTVDRGVKLAIPGQQFWSSWRLSAMTTTNSCLQITRTHLLGLLPAALPTIS